MNKVLIGGIVGGVVLFIWSALVWTVVPLHKPSLHNIPNEEAVIGALKANMGEKGLYVFPAMPDMGAGQTSADAYTQKMKQGPVGVIVFDPQGMDSMMPGQFIVGFLLDLVAALLAAWLLSRSTALASPYVSRVMFCGVLGIFASFISFLPGWNWMGYPMDYTTAMVADTILGWLITGLVIAAIVKAPATQQA